jgi:hypothetical protein
MTEPRNLERGGEPGRATTTARRSKASPSERDEKCRGM